MLNVFRPLVGALVTLSMFVVPTAAPPPATANDPGTCFGEPPTIVGIPGEALKGTPGPDVVITNGSLNVNTRGGDDLLCITGDADHRYRTGPGNDRIDSTTGAAGHEFILISPGQGDDEVMGGSSREYVNTADATRLDLDADVITTAGGKDYVITGGYLVNRDVITVGPDADEVVAVDALPNWRFRIRGGQGRDRLVVYIPGDLSARWKIDNRSQQAERFGRVVARWTSFARFRLLTSGPTTFVGGETSESIIMRDSAWPIHVRAGGGDDIVKSRIRFAGGSEFDGGSGNDTLNSAAGTEFGRGARLSFDLASGIIQESLRDGQTTFRIATRFENADLVGRGTLIISGTDGPNRLEGTARRQIAINGRAGDDELVGNVTNDILIGGPGHDAADGSEGIDRCEAEVQMHCE